ncbi:hypothetical protein D3C76_1448110 [compost metagenome]
MDSVKPITDLQYKITSITGTMLNDMGTVTGLVSSANTIHNNMLATLVTAKLVSTVPACSILAIARLESTRRNKGIRNTADPASSTCKSMSFNATTMPSPPLPAHSLMYF